MFKSRSLLGLILVMFCLTSLNASQEKPAAFVPFEKAVSGALEEAGVSEEIIKDVLNHAKTNIDDRAVLPQSATTPISVQGTEGTNDTFYGSNAGFSDTTSSMYNSFFGTGAGYTTSTGQQNSFMGYHAGYTNDGYTNTFLGHYSGRLNTTGGNNLFLGLILEAPTQPETIISSVDIPQVIPTQQGPVMSSPDTGRDFTTP